MLCLAFLQRHEAQSKKCLCFDSTWRRSIVVEDIGDDITVQQNVILK
jgi:hypothetical protein